MSRRKSPEKREMHKWPLCVWEVMEDRFINVRVSFGKYIARTPQEACAQAASNGGRATGFLYAVRLYPYKPNLGPATRREVRPHHHRPRTRA